MTAASAGRRLVDELGLRLVDADNHYYEPEDAFTRHLPEPWRDLAFRWVTTDTGKRRLVVNNELTRNIVNPTFDPVAKPGALQTMFREQGSFDYRRSGDDMEPIRPEYRDRDARLRVMDEQAIDQVWLFPTLGVTVDHLLHDDPALHVAALHAFNRFLDDDWGFDYRGRIHAVPCLTLADPGAAVAELDWALERGARLVHLVAGPVPGARPRSLADAELAPFWARVHEAGITIALHGAHSSGYFRTYAARWGELAEPPTHLLTRFQMVTCMYRPVYDMLAALVLHGVFERFPRVRVITVENGGYWVDFLLHNLAKVRHRRDFGREHDDPVEVFRRHVWIEPFAEDDVVGLVRSLGADHVLFGSDWPHPEGTVEPAQFFDELGGLPPDDLRRIGRANALALMTEPGVEE